MTELQLLLEVAQVVELEKQVMVLFNNTNLVNQFSDELFEAGIVNNGMPDCKRKPKDLGDDAFAFSLTLAEYKKIQNGERNIVDQSQMAQNNNPPQQVAALPNTTNPSNISLRSVPMARPRPVPEGLICTITGQIMAEPVCTKAGFTYEKEAILSWFANHDTEPRTNLKVVSKELIPSNDKKSEIESFLARNPAYYYKYRDIDVYLPRSYLEELADAIAKGELGRVNIILARDPRLLTIKIVENYTAFHLACKYSNDILNYILRLFVERGIFNADFSNFNLAAPMDWNPIILHEKLLDAVKENNLADVNKLVNLGASVFIFDTTGMTLLHHSVKHLDTRIFNYSTAHPLNP